jgi:hypothetical protein
MTSITKHLLNAEERARHFFERAPFVQAFLAGIGVIVFWRGIWEFLDINQISPITSVVIGSLILLFVGVFLQTFIGNSIIIKNVQQGEILEKRAIKEMKGEVNVEEITLASIALKLDELSKKIEGKV